MLYAVKFRMKTPIVISEALHLDALLMAVHPDAVPPTEVNRQLRENTLPILELPITKASIPEDPDNWVYCASTIDLSEDARPYTGTYTKRKGKTDPFYLRKNIMTIGGVFKDSIRKANGVIASHASFMAETSDPDALAFFCNRITHLGKLRGMGYGQVQSVYIEPMCEQESSLTLWNGTRAVRNLPACMCEKGGTSWIAPRPPYWDMSRRELGANPGECITLKETIKYVDS